MAPGAVFVVKLAIAETTMEDACLECCKRHRRPARPSACHGWPRGPTSNPVPIAATGTGSLTDVGHEGIVQSIFGCASLQAGPRLPRRCGAGSSFGPGPRLHGQYLVDHLKPGSTVVMINGDQTSATGLEFKQVALEALAPAFKSGRLKLGYSADIPQFTPATAQTRWSRHSRGSITMSTACYRPTTVSGVGSSLRSRPITLPAR
jgi:hypothetical protein